MSKRFDNKRILYILAGLIVILGLTLLVKAPRERATIKSKLVEIDTARVNKIIIHPKADGRGTNLNLSEEWDMDSTAE